jgi:dihydroorotate dehydrogenase
MYRLFIKPIFFLLPAERAHYTAMSLLRFTYHIPGMKALLSTIFRPKNTALKRSLFGLEFDNPVGLAAGFDKDARWVDELSALGFGFIEIASFVSTAKR